MFVIALVHGALTDLNHEKAELNTGLRQSKRQRIALRIRRRKKKFTIYN